MAAPSAANGGPGDDDDVDMEDAGPGHVDGVDGVLQARASFAAQAGSCCEARSIKQVKKVVRKNIDHLKDLIRQLGDHAEAVKEQLLQNVALPPDRAVVDNRMFVAVHNRPLVRLPLVAGDRDQRDVDALAFRFAVSKCTDALTAGVEVVKASEYGADLVPANTYSVLLLDDLAYDLIQREEPLPPSDKFEPVGLFKIISERSNLEHGLFRDSPCYCFGAEQFRRSVNAGNSGAGYDVRPDIPHAHLFLKSAQGGARNSRRVYGSGVETETVEYTDCFFVAVEWRFVLLIYDPNRWTQVGPAKVLILERDCHKKAAKRKRKHPGSITAGDFMKLKKVRPGDVVAAPAAPDGSSSGSSSSSAPVVLAQAVDIDGDTDMISLTPAEKQTARAAAAAAAAAAKSTHTANRGKRG